MNCLLVHLANNEHLNLSTNLRTRGSGLANLRGSEGRICRFPSLDTCGFAHGKAHEEIQGNQQLTSRTRRSTGVHILTVRISGRRDGAFFLRNGGCSREVSCRTEKTCPSKARTLSPHGTTRNGYRRTGLFFSSWLRFRFVTPECDLRPALLGADGAEGCAEGGKEIKSVTPREPIAMAQKMFLRKPLLIRRPRYPSIPLRGNRTVTNEGFSRPDGYLGRNHAPFASFFAIQLSTASRSGSGPPTRCSANSHLRHRP